MEYLVSILYAVKTLGRGGQMGSKTAVVTGASGYIGSCLVRSLLLNHWKVIVILRKDSGTKLLLDCLEQIKVYRYDGVTESMMQIFEEIGEIDIVFHLASCFIGEHHWQQVEELIKSNILFGTVLLEAATAVGCKRMVNTSSYVQHYEQEEYNPSCLYAATKEAFEKIIDYYIEARGLRCITLELFDTYGLKDPRNKIIPLLQRCYENGEPLEMSAGEQEIDLVYIDDVIRAYLKAEKLTQNSIEKQQKYMVATMQPYTLREVVEIINQLTGNSLQITFGARPYRQREMMKVWRKGKILPGWRADITLPEGLKRIFQTAIELEEDEI